MGTCLDENDRGEEQLGANDLVRDEQPLEGAVAVGLEPLIDGAVALGLDEADPAVVALEVGAAGVGAPEAAARGVVVVAPGQQRLLDPRDGEALHGRASEEVDPPQVVQLHGQVRGRRLVNHVHPRHPARPDGGELQAVHKFLLFLDRHGAMMCARGC